MKRLYVNEGVVNWSDLDWGNDILSQNTPVLFEKFKKCFNIVHYKIYTDREDGEYIKKLDSTEQDGDWSSGGFFVFGFTMELADGSIWYYRGSADSTTNSNFIVIVDVNGKKGPNQAGRDLFKLVYTKSGILTSTWSKTYMKDIRPDMTDEEFNQLYEAMEQYYPCERNAGLNTSGLCFEKIKADGWEMNY